jgi:hypothetical protein
MDLEFKENELILSKEPSIIDNLVFDFSDILTKNNIRHVLFSDYISILFGKDGMNEEIDILIQNISFEKFLKLWLAIENTYECKNTNDPIDAYNAFLKNHHVLRFAKKLNLVPDFKIKIVKDEIDRCTLKYRKKIILGERNLFISPLEMQISYNLFQGSEKNIDDARFLYKLSKEKLNMILMDRFLNELNIPKESVGKYLR